jgi:plasmid stabilization system protein ParE
MSVEDETSFEESIAEASRGGKARSVRVRYMPRAFRELQDIFAYIDDHSPLGGRNVKSRVHAIIELVASHPHSGRRIGKRGL